MNFFTSNTSSPSSPSSPSQDFINNIQSPSSIPSGSSFKSMSTIASTIVPEPLSVWGNILWYSIIILILSLLGFNLFSYLADVTNKTSGFFGPLLSTFGFNLGETIKQTTNISAKGTKTAIDITAGTVDSAVNLLETGIGRNSEFNTSTAKAIQSAESNLPKPDEAGSKTQQGRNFPKSGYCYIGEDRGFRSCIHVGEGDKCMSGDIFPSKDVCINPNLRV